MPNGSETVMSRGPFMQIVKVRHCPCPDGKARTVKITGESTNYFSTPGSVKVKGKTVTGFVTGAPTYNEDGLIFVPNQKGKNAHLLRAECP